MHFSLPATYIIHQILYTNSFGTSYKKTYHFIGFIRNIHISFISKCYRLNEIRSVRAQTFTTNVLVQGTPLCISLKPLNLTIRRSKRLIIFLKTEISPKYGGGSKRVAKFLQESFLIVFDLIWKVLLSDRNFVTLHDPPLKYMHFLTFQRKISYYFLLLMLPDIC